MTRVKICGITRVEDARLAVALGASALGFNFYPLSPRYIDPLKAKTMISELPPMVTPVGVFADTADAGSVAATARAAGVTAVQVHGPRFPENWEALAGFKLIRAVAVKAEFDPSTLRALRADAILLDAYDPVHIGGSGKRIDWNLARRAGQQGKIIILAGGLTPENVAEAILKVNPFAVDVASGVESAPGIKDHQKLKAFFESLTAAHTS